jgi:ADP-ribosylglycohydrolase
MFFLTTPRDRARLSLEGLSVGDAFGERFFVYPSDMAQRTDVPYFEAYHTIIEQQIAPPLPWPYTDDSEMALSIIRILRQHGTINQDMLAKSFFEHYTPSRGYGPAMHRLMRQIGSGADWRSAAGNLFEGQGSYGNGAAMRVAPVGAFFADNLDQVIDQQRGHGELGRAARRMSHSFIWCCRSYLRARYTANSPALRPSTTRCPRQLRVLSSAMGR